MSVIRSVALGICLLSLGASPLALAAAPDPAPASPATPAGPQRPGGDSERPREKVRRIYPVFDELPEAKDNRLPNKAEDDRVPEKAEDDRLLDSQTEAPAQPSGTSYLPLAGVICVSAGLASLGAGVYYWTRATSLTDSANKTDSYNQADYDQGRRAEKMQWIFYTAGAAAIVTGATLYIYGRWWSTAKKPRLSLAPVVGPGASGLAAHGSF